MEDVNIIKDWPVILNQSLQGSDWDKLLRSLRVKIRGSNSTLENSLIFPKSGVAFLILPLDKCTVGQYDVKTEVVQLVEKFTQIHASGYVLALAPLHGERELKVFSSIQTKFIETKLEMIPIHNIDEGIKAMINIAKVMCKPTSELMFRRLNEWACNFDTENAVKTMLLQIGLTEHQAHILLDCLGSLSSIAKADKEELLDCSLDSETADKIMKFFSNGNQTNQVVLL